MKTYIFGVYSIHKNYRRYVGIGTKAESSTFENITRSYKKIIFGI